MLCAGVFPVLFFFFFLSDLYLNAKHHKIGCRGEDDVVAPCRQHVGELTRILAKSVEFILMFV